MKVGILTAALQELTPREVRDADPDRAIEDWLAFARELGADDIQLSAALHPSEADVPPEAMLDPVANTLDLRQPFDRARATRVQAAMSRHRHPHLRSRLLRQPAAPRCRDPAEEARLRPARVRRGRAARRGRRVRLRRTQPAAQHGREPRSTSRNTSSRCSGRRRRAGSPTASSSARCPAGRPATTGTTTSPTHPARGLRCTASARSTASAISSASTTTRRTRS